MGNDVSYKIIGTMSLKFKIFDGVVRALKDVKHVPKLTKNVIFLAL